MIGEVRDRKWEKSQRYPLAGDRAPIIMIPTAASGLESVAPASLPAIPLTGADPRWFNII
jgi:hypothetical protein